MTHALSVLGICILVLIIVIEATFLAVFYQKTNECQLDGTREGPGFWCWDDWQCPFSVQCSIPGQTGCWAGTTGSYFGNGSNLCTYPGGTGGTGIPEGCTCTWQDTVGGIAHKLCDIQPTPPS